MDFCCFHPKLVVEVDGGQHAERAVEDAARTASLQLRGYRVMRFWNHEVLCEMEIVLERIAAELKRARRDEESRGRATTVQKKIV